MNRNRGLLTAAVPLLLLGACAQPGAAGDTASGAPVVESTTASVDPKQVALRVEHRGGFVPAELIPSRLPLFIVYADGRMLTEGPVPAIYPGKALPNLQEVRVSPERVRELTDAAVAAGVKTGADFGTPGVVDAPSTRITVVTAGGEQVAEVIALNETAPDDSVLTKDQVTARKRLTGFLGELNKGFSGATSPAPKQYLPERLAVLASPYQDTGDDMGGDPVRWPGPDLPGGYLNEQLKINCLTVDGTAKDAVWAAAEKANGRTPWESAGKKWQIQFRPLLPDETGCDSLLRQA